MITSLNVITGSIYVYHTCNIVCMIVQIPYIIGDVINS